MIVFVWRCLRLSQSDPIKKHAGYLIFYPFYPKVELIICQDALGNLAQRKTVQSAHPPPAIILVLKSLNQTLSAWKNISPLGLWDLRHQTTPEAREVMSQNWVCQSITKNICSASTDLLIRRWFNSSAHIWSLEIIFKYFPPRLWNLAYCDCHGWKHVWFPVPVTQNNVVPHLPQEMAIAQKPSTAQA